MTSEIQAFLALDRIAMIGVSHDARHFSRAVYRAWRDRGYDLVPVNPSLENIDAIRGFARIQDVDPRPEGALVMTPAAAAEQIVHDCAAAGVRRVWLYRRSPAAEAFCKKNGIQFIAGECPMMYLPNSALIHRVHRWFHDRRAS